MKISAIGNLVSYPQCGRFSSPLKRIMVTTTWVRILERSAASSCQNIMEGYYIHSCVKMRYKGNFRPTYLLGIQQPLSSDTVSVLTWPDPVSYTWDPLDSDLLQRLSTRRFVSLAVDNHLKVPANPDDLAHFVAAPPDVSGKLFSSLEMGNLK